MKNFIKTTFDGMLNPFRFYRKWHGGNWSYVEIANKHDGSKMRFWVHEFVMFESRDYIVKIVKMEKW